MKLWVNVAQEFHKAADQIFTLMEVGKQSQV